MKLKKEINLGRVISKSFNGWSNVEYEIRKDPNYLDYQHIATVRSGDDSLVTCFISKEGYSSKREVIRSFKRFVKHFKKIGYEI